MAAVGFFIYYKKKHGRYNVGSLFSYIIVAKCREHKLTDVAENQHNCTLNALAAIESVGKEN